MTLRALIASTLLATALAAPIASAADFQPATVLEAATGSGQKAVNAIAVRLGALQITAEYTTLFANGPKAASLLVIGDTVQARTDGKSLYFIGPSGQTIKARIVRRERVAQ